jgi:crossover junction endodeoxyribonuclease RuvC
MRIFAIDPGLSGAWALVVDGRPTLCGDMPTTGDGTKRRVSASVLGHAMKGADLCVIELVHSMPKQGVASSFRFGLAYGAALAVPAVLEIPIELIVPQHWKSHHKLRGSEKEASRQRALDLCPWLAPMLQRKRDDGRAEAVLLGLYGAATWDHAREAA